MIIRQETQGDHQEVHRLIKKAFKSTRYSDGMEQDIVEALRKGETFVPELSLVAEVNAQVVGYILFTNVKIGDSTQLTLAPLAVLPEYQRQGIGRALIAEGHRIAKALGYDCVVVLGSDAYYPQFGYIPAAQVGIQSPYDIPSKNYMVYALSRKTASIKGTVRYPKAFDM